MKRSVRDTVYLSLFLLNLYKYKWDVSPLISTAGGLVNTSYNLIYLIIHAHNFVPGILLKDLVELIVNLDVDCKRLGRIGTFAVEVS